MKMTNLKKLTDMISNPVKASAYIDELLSNDKGIHWHRDLRKIQRFLEDGKARFEIIKGGNSKLPFLAFSALPYVTCPGAGACADYCYSRKAWRYPSAFSRQLQNTVLLMSNDGRAQITAAMDKAMDKQEIKRQINNGEKIDFRLYVDGDFDSHSTMDYWFNLLQYNRQLKVYGYSKSFELFLSYSKSFPNNYLLNVSDGHKYSSDTQSAMLELPITRGEFIAIPVETGLKKKDRTTETGRYTKEYQKDVRNAFNGKGFVCPGRCGDCTNTNGHACGSDKFKGIPIYIGLH